MTSFSSATHRSTTSALSEDRHLVGVAAEGCNVLTHPAQSLDHVLHSVVSLSGAIASRHEAENSQAIVQCDKNDVVVDKEIGSVDKAVTVASCEAAAVDPHHNCAISGETRSVNVQEQAVFTAASFQAKPSTARADVSVVLGISDACPSAVWNWIAESQVAYGGLGVRDSLEGKVVGLQNASRKLDSLELPG